MFSSKWSYFLRKNPMCFGKTPKFLGKRPKFQGKKTKIHCKWSDFQGKLN